MILGMLLFVIAGYLTVKAPVTLFAYTPWLKPRIRLLIGTIVALSCGVTLIALRTEQTRPTAREAPRVSHVATARITLFPLH